MSVGRILVLLALAPGGLARAHDGEDHAHEAVTPVAPASGADALSAVASSTGIDAVLRVPSTPADATLLLADWATSAPVTDATATLTLSGPASAQASFGATGSPGAYHGPLALTAPGTWAGALVVTTPTATELLAIDGLRVGIGAVGPAHPAGLPPWSLALAGLGGLALGWALGRRRGAVATAAVLVGAALLRTPEVAAHGGEDHGTPEPPKAPDLATTSASGSALALPLDTQFLTGLRTTVLARGEFTERVPALGALLAAPGDLVTIAAPVDGTLTAPAGGLPRPGQRVRAGQLLGTLLEAPGRADRAALAQARAGAATTLEQARAALALAERDAASMTTLGDALPARERLARETSLSAAQVAVREAEAALSALSGEGMPLLAPVSGVLGRMRARPGERLAAGAPLATLRGTPDAPWAEVRVPEREALGLRAGAEAVVTSNGAPEAVLAAVVLDPGQQVDTATGTVTVTLALRAPTEVLPGSGVTAWIARTPAREALVIPTAAVIEHDGAPLAFVKTGPETFAARRLRLGARSGDAWEVLGGLSAGERVVTVGSGTLRNVAGL